MASPSALGKAAELWRYLLFRLNPSLPLEAKWREPLAALLAPLEPRRADGVEKVRVGGPHDGGYVMLDDFGGIAAAYSLGIGPEVSWDLGIAGRGIPVWQYDPTVEGPAVPHARFTFRPWRIGPVDDAAAGIVALTTLLEQNGHASADLLLKMDIEDAEWDVLAAIDPERLRVFRQVLIELHSLHRVTDEAWRGRAAAALANATRHHQCVHVHGNNLSAIVTAGDLRVTSSLEVTLARRDRYRLVPTEETFPGRLDRPNSRIFPDVRLGTFRFGA